MAEPATHRHQRLRLAAIGLLGATATVQRREEIETDLMEAEVAARRFDTTERRVTLFWRSVFSCITVALIGISVYWCLEGSHSTLPFVTGPFGVFTGIASYFGRPEREADP
jgi:hypothetical protein